MQNLRLRFYTILKTVSCVVSSSSRKSSEHLVSHSAKANSQKDFTNAFIYKKKKKVWQWLRVRHKTQVNNIN